MAGPAKCRARGGNNARGESSRSLPDADPLSTTPETDEGPGEQTPPEASASSPASIGAIGARETTHGDTLALS